MGVGILMKSILFLFTRRGTLILLTFYLVLAFLLMSLNEPLQLRGFRIAILKGISWVNSIKSYFIYLKNIDTQNKKLKIQLLEESIKNQQMQEYMLENLRLRKLLRLKDELEYSFIPARVIGVGQEQSIKSLILDVGRKDNIKINQAVVTEKGLVGKILDSEKEYSITQVLMDRNSLVSARLQKSREIGLIGWSGNLWLDLYYIPKDVELERGEVVITSGLSQIYPKGLKIGVVAEILENEYELFKQIKVKPAVNFNRLEEVFVLQMSDSLRQDIIE